MKASAVAHPIQGLVKYHGLKDPVRRIPFHDSISVCTAPLTSHTTVEPMDDGNLDVTIDDQRCEGRPLDRVRAVLDAIRDKAGDDRPCKIVSVNDFPQFVGLGSSSSGFAALTLAAAKAYDLDLDLEKLSEIARLGAGSACRALTGGVSEWITDRGRSYSREMIPEDAIDWRIVVPLIRHEEPTENVHHEVTTSPLFQARVAAMPAALASAREAIQQRDLAGIGAAAEKDTLSLHAVTMTGSNGHLTWRPGTVDVIHRVRAMRANGVPVWFSIDTGATAYLNTDAEHEDAVAEAVADVAGVSEVLRLRPGGPGRIVDDHLF